MNIRNKQIIITGGTGQIGTRLLEIITNMGVVPIVLARDENRSEMIQEYIKEDKILFIKADLSSSKEQIKHALNGFKPAILIHLGSIVDQRTEFFDSTRQMISVNLKGLINLLNSLTSLEMICFASTTSVYGKPEYLPIDEKHPVNPENTYAASKLAAEKYLTLYSNLKGIPTSILRISSVYSELQYAPELKRAIPDFLRSIAKGDDLVVWGRGIEGRDYIYIDDVISGILLSIEKQADGIFNIATDQCHFVKEVAELIRMFSGNNVSIRYKHADETDVSYVYDISLAKNKWGFIPKYNLNLGLDKCVASLINDKSYSSKSHS